MAGWLTAWLVGWRTSWLTGGLTAWVAGRMADWLTAWLVGWRTSWLTGWLTAWVCSRGQVELIGADFAPLQQAAIGAQYIGQRHQSARDAVDRPTHPRHLHIEALDVVLVGRNAEEHRIGPDIAGVEQCPISSGVGSTVHQVVASFHVTIVSEVCDETLLCGRGYRLLVVHRMVSAAGAVA